MGLTMAQRKAVTKAIATRYKRAEFRETPRPSATRAKVRCWHTMASSAHRRPGRDSFTRGSAALLVTWHHTCPHPVHR